MIYTRIKISDNSRHFLTKKESVHSVEIIDRMFKNWNCLLHNNKLFKTEFVFKLIIYDTKCSDLSNMLNIFNFMYILM